MELDAPFVSGEFSATAWEEPVQVQEEMVQEEMMCVKVESSELCGSFDDTDLGVDSFFSM
jgi:hypothetical protein